jgi:hypothetical protein
MFGSSLKNMSRGISKISSKKLSRTIYNISSIKTRLALNWVIANIVFLVKDAGYSIHQMESTVYRGSYTFYIENSDTDPLRPRKSTIISSVDIVLTWDNTILETPRTRSLKRITTDVFYIQLVKTNPNHRNEGWATLLLMYTIAYLQIVMPHVKIFTLSDESANSRHIKKNIYDRLGFIYMYNEGLDISQRNITIPTTQKKILDFNIEHIYSWATVRCLKLINDNRKKERMGLIEPFNPIAGKSKKQRNKKTRKQTRKQVRKYSRKIPMKRA